jgi:ankyrin repeat protein
MRHRALILLLLCLASASVTATTAAAGQAKRDPLARCPEAPTSARFDPSDPESVRRQLRTAPRIILALGLDRHEQLRALLKRGENPNICILGSSLLTYSVGNGDTEEVEILLDGGASTETPRDSNGSTPLLFALGMSHFDVARVLMSRRANPLATSDGGMTALIELATAHAPDSLHAEQLDLAQTLIERGVPVNAQMNIPRSTALMMATIRGDRDLVRLLLDNGADPGLQDSRGQTALDFAHRKGFTDIAELLSHRVASPSSAAASESR